MAAACGRPSPSATAMSTSPAADGSMVIARHEVFVTSRDGGKTWAQVTTDLPSLDIHGFTRDPSDMGPPRHRRPLGKAPTSVPLSPRGNGSVDRPIRRNRAFVSAG